MKKQRAMLRTVPLVVLALVGVMLGGVAEGGSFPAAADDVDDGRATPNLGKSLFSPGQLDWELSETDPKNYGGMYGEDGDLVIAYVGDPMKLKETIDAYSKTHVDLAMPTRYRQVAHSWAELEASRDALLKEVDTVQRDLDFTIVSWNPDAKDNALEIEVLGDPEVSTRLTPELQDVVGEVPVEVTPTAEPVVADTDRGDDSPPWNAGDRIYDENAIVPGYNNFGACSSGFGVHTATQTYLLTAGHCSDVDGTGAFYWNGDPIYKRKHGMGFHQAISYVDGGYDSALINARSSRIVWTATDTRSYITASYLPVADAGNYILINEGATSVPWQSGHVAVIDVGVCISYADTTGSKYTCHLHRTEARPFYRGSLPGDSGGPWVFYSGFGPLAVGQHVAGNGARLSYYHPVDVIFRDNIFGLGPMAVNT